MKRVICLLVAIIFVSMCIFSTGCGNDKRIAIQTKEGIKTFKFQQYGLLDTYKKNSRVAYKVIGWNIFWVIVFVETIFVPVIIFGFYLYEPVGPVIENEPGAIKEGEIK